MTEFFVLAQGAAAPAAQPVAAAPAAAQGDIERSPFAPGPPERNKDKEKKE